MLMVSVLQSKDTHWWIRLKSQIQPFYPPTKNETYLQRHTGLKYDYGKRFSKEIE
jgi:hypothetical protein